MLPSLTAPRSRPHRALIVLLVTLVSALLLSGCGGSSEKKAASETPADVMKQAKKLLDDASSVRIALSTDSTPSGGNGVLAATGDITHDPAFKGDVKVVLSGLTATVPITSTGGKVYAKLPLQTSYSTIDPEEYGAPDPSDFADPDNGLSALLTRLDGLKKGKKARSGDEILTSYSGTLPGAAVKKIIPSASAKETYETVVGVDEKGYARTVKITGVFFSGNDDVTYDVKLSDYDKDVKITAPTG
jgi:lipoprotein LprG